ncbi:MAG: hypothetical protein KF688_19800 [Pirellulales bacterium]|nr:hypothetical protein [Pirellulales bacterium]
MAGLDRTLDLDELQANLEAAVRPFVIIDIADDFTGATTMFQGDKVGLQPGWVSVLDSVVQLQRLYLMQAAIRSDDAREAATCGLLLGMDWLQATLTNIYKIRPIDALTAKAIESHRNSLNGKAGKLTADEWDKVRAAIADGVSHGASVAAACSKIEAKLRTGKFPGVGRVNISAESLRKRYSRRRQ